MVAVPDVANRMTESAITTVVNVQQNIMNTQEKQENFIAALVYVLSVVKARCLEASGFALTVGLNNRKDESKSPRVIHKGSKIMQSVVKAQGKDIARGRKMVSVQGVG